MTERIYRSDQELPTIPLNWLDANGATDPFFGKGGVATAPRGDAPGKIVRIDNAGRVLVSTGTSLYRFTP